MSYRALYFDQGFAARTLIDLLDTRGEEAVIDYMLAESLFNWEGDIRPQLQHSNFDRIAVHGHYFINYNVRVGYLGVEFQMQTPNWKEFS